MKATMSDSNRFAYMTVRQWQLIDAVFDNEVKFRIDDDEPEESVRKAQAIREAGWQQVASRTDLPPGFAGWPTADAVVEVSLDAEQWALIRSVLRESDEIRGDDDPEGTRLSVEVQQVLAAQLGP